MLASAGLPGVASRPSEAKAREYQAACAALKGRSSKVDDAFVSFSAASGSRALPGIAFPNRPAGSSRGEGRDLRQLKPGNFKVGWRHDWKSCPSRNRPAPASVEGTRASYWS